MRRDDTPIYFALTSMTRNNTNETAALPGKRHSVGLAVAGVVLPLLCGCEALVPRATPATPQVVRAESEVQSHIDFMAAMATAGPARQVEMIEETERSYEIAPTTSNSLRFAGALGLAGHAGSNPARSAEILRTLLASPEKLTPGERTFATTLLDLVEAQLQLAAENRRLLATFDESTRAQVNFERRALAQAEENARLRKALEEAQQKLDAITDIERTIIERNVTPPANREPAPQSEATPPGR